MKFTAVRFFCLSLLVLVLGLPAFGQNTKGDRPTPPARESRFKTPKKTKQPRQPWRRVKRGDDRPDRTPMPPRQATTKKDRPGKPITPQFSKTRPSRSDRPWQGDITGRRIQPKFNTSRARNVYPQPPSTGYSSEESTRSRRSPDNPAVRRVRKMQREDPPEPKPGKPIRPTFHKTKPQHSERAWRGDITGRPIRAKSSDGLRPPPGQGPSAVPGSGPFPRMRRQGIVPSRAYGRARRSIPGGGWHPNNSSQTAKFQSDHNRAAMRMLNRHNRSGQISGQTRQVAPSSASGPYRRNRSINMWANFRRPGRQGDRAITKDLAGKPLRMKNFQTQRGVLTNPTLNLRGGRASGERPYEGPAAGGHISRTQSGRAWQGDIAHRRIRGGFRSKKGEPQAGRPIFGRGQIRLDRRTANYQGNLRRGRMGFGNQGEEFSGNMRARRAFQGGGSVSAGWNNKGRAIQGRAPGRGARGVGYSGNIRQGKRGFGNQGEEYSGNIRRRRILNDQGEEYSGNIRTRRTLNDQGEEFSGNIRTRRTFNDQGEEYRGNIRTRRTFNDQGEEYRGNIRTRRAFSNQGEEYRGDIRFRKFLNDQGEEFTGTIKFRKPDKGGGSRSGGVWNNRNTPIMVRVPRSQHARVAAYQGDMRAGRRVFANQGEEYRGNIRAGRPWKGGGSVSGKLWNNNEQPIQVRTYDNQTKISRYSGNLRARRPEKGGGSVSGQLWNNNEQAIQGKSYTGLTRVSRYQGEKRMTGRHERNPNSAEGALPTLKASNATLAGGQHTRGVKRDWEYIRNPSSAEDAQRTREPGRAFGRSTDFQGNIRVKKFDLFSKSDLHPDAKFVKINKNNVPEEKDMLTNFKLWWARLFKKAETQPDHLKENDNSRKPRYDKGEAGLWYD